MEVWMLWHGGSGYSASDVTTDTEHFASLPAAKRDFDSRPSDPYYPCLEREDTDAGGPSAWIFFYDPNDESCGPGDPYPDRILEYGPRGGLKVSYA
jgi:hypothetical protein